MTIDHTMNTSDLYLECGGTDNRNPTRPSDAADIVVIQSKSGKELSWAGLIDAALKRSKRIMAITPTNHVYVIFLYDGNFYVKTADKDCIQLYRNERIDMATRHMLRIPLHIEIYELMAFLSQLVNESKKSAS